MGSVTFIYCGVVREINEGQAHFLVDQLKRVTRRHWHSAPAERIREEAGANGQRPGDDIELDKTERDELLAVLDQADADSELDAELRSLQMMLSRRALARRELSGGETPVLPGPGALMTPGRRLSSLPASSPTVALPYRY